MTQHSLRRRVRPDQWQTLEEAAEFAAQDIGTFALSAALEKARQIIEEKRRYRQAIGEAS
jgi:uncharacterized protein (DUF1778 family)